MGVPARVVRIAGEKVDFAAGRWTRSTSPTRCRRELQALSSRLEWLEQLMDEQARSKESMKICNSATHKQEEFVPHEPGKVSMYLRPHYGVSLCPHWKPAQLPHGGCAGEAAATTGYDVKRVMNITDVGHTWPPTPTHGRGQDARGPRREHKSVMEIAQFYTDAFFADCKSSISNTDVVQPPPV